MELDIQTSTDERLLKPGFRLGPFAFRTELEQRLGEELDFTKFRQLMSDQFVDLPQPLSDSTIEYLYDTCVEAHIDKAVMAKAREITRKKSWQRARRRLRRLITSLHQYQEIELEEHLRAKLGTAQDSVTTRALAQLTADLEGLQKACEWWDGFAQSSPWGAFYRSYIWQMNKHLQKRYQLKQEYRVDIVAAAISNTRLASRVSSGAIARSLTREKTRPRRFVYTG